MEQEILNLFTIWNDALQTKDSKKVAELYHETDGILLPTVSPKVRHNREEIADYFDHFLAKNPVGTITESNIRVYGDVAVNSGLYTFALDDGNGGRVDVEARFTYVYKKEADGWYIVEHHSSVLP